ncbi:MATE family efflux transporter [Halobiforma lacisalsi AJ5]|uniref:MATE efflux family protein n=1 Tax=Natronobacterium lacisalsi AJ5 TaxID=358396 RepID=M0L2Y0_NATLA|nr:MATE family efflux transporter [Halobiforma lacisalsi]APW98289.1 MATE family efflux transporter [Halobiforma lacisalsi AJ5]EMA27891.1 MATE efflux family protein [Halobiforma lacisalsi AJ5]
MGIKGAIDSLFRGPEALDLTSGDIGWPLFYLSLPIVVQNLFQVLYNLADTFWLGRHSTEALSAITFAFPIVFLMISLALGVSVAGSVLVAQHTGAGNEERAAYAASQTMAYAAVISIVLGVLGYVFVDDITALLGVNETVAPLVVEYMRVYAVGLFAVFGFAVFLALMRGYGDTVTPMYVMAGSVILNIVLDPILIFGFDANPLLGVLGLGGLETAALEATGFTGWGIGGAAIATVGSRALALAVGLAIMFRGKRGVRIRLSEMVPDLLFGRTILTIGLPASVEGAARSLSITMLLVVVATFPNAVSGAYGIGTRVFSVIFLPALAVSQGIETMTGQNIGAGKVGRAAETNHFGARAMLGLLTVGGGLIVLAAGPIASVFSPDPAVVDHATTFLRVTGLTFGFIGVMRAYTGGFRGSGHTMIAAAISLVTLGFVRLPVAWIASSTFDVMGLWIAFPISNVVGGIVAYLWFERGTWRDGNLTADDPSLEGVGSNVVSTNDD